MEQVVLSEDGGNPTEELIGMGWLVLHQGVLYLVRKDGLH